MQRSFIKHDIVATGTSIYQFITKNLSCISSKVIFPIIFQSVEIPYSYYWCKCLDLALLVKKRKPYSTSCNWIASCVTYLFMKLINRRRMQPLGISRYMRSYAFNVRRQSNIWAFRLPPVTHHNLQHYFHLLVSRVRQIKNIVGLWFHLQERYL